MSKTKVPRIKPVENYSMMPAAEVINRASAVYTGLNGSTHFTNLPVPLADFKAQIDSVSALTAEARDGSKKLIAEKNKQLHALIKMISALGRYVELNCNDDMALFRSSGFEPVSTTKTAPATLSKRSAASITVPPADKSWFGSRLYRRPAAMHSATAPR